MTNLELLNMVLEKLNQELESIKYEDFEDFPNGYGYGIERAIEIVTEIQRNKT